MNAVSIVGIVGYVAVVLGFLAVVHIIVDVIATDTRCKLFKRVVGSFETEDAIVLLGFYGFTYNEIRRKIEKAHKRGYEYEGYYSPMREVDEFPDYLSKLRIY